MKHRDLYFVALILFLMLMSIFSLVQAQVDELRGISDRVGLSRIYQQ